MLGFSLVLESQPMTDRPNSNANRVSPQWSEAITHAVELLTHYSFDLGGNTAETLLDRWQAEYPPTWIRWAVIEALYQGRYKAVSVAQILQHWQRRQQARYHFNYEFERMVCQRFPRNLSQSRQQPAQIETVDRAVLPALTPIADESPAWAELAEQIQQDEVTPIATRSIAPSEPIPVLAPLEPPEALMNRVARLQAGVDALIEQATSSLNASTDALKTKLQPDSDAPVSSGATAQNGKTPTIEPEEHPPIDQFMPLPDGSEFHSKLKAVAEQEQD